MFTPVGCARSLALQHDGLPVEVHVADVTHILIAVQGEALDSFVIQRPPQVVAYGRLEACALGFAWIAHLVSLLVVGCSQSHDKPPYPFPLIMAAHGI